MDWSEWAKQFQEPIAKVILAALSAIAAWLGIKVVQLVGELRKKVTLEKNQILARVAVQAVDQQAKTSEGLNTGAEKKAAAVSAVQVLAPKADPVLVEHLVESAVAETKTAKGEGGG